MSITKPDRVQYAWKYTDKKLGDFAKDLLKELRPSIDCNPGLDGVQNPFTLPAVPFQAVCPGIDVFAIGIMPDGSSELPGFWRAGLQFTIKETGGIDSSQKTFEILAPANVLDLALFDHLEAPSGEIMRVEGITTGSPNYTVTAERGAHGTDAAAVAYDGKLELLTPRVDTKRIILLGDTEALAAPVMNTPQGLESGILLSWTHSYTMGDLLRLKGWQIYYSDSSGIDISDPETYDGIIDIEGIDKTTIFNPRASGFADVDTTYYFTMSALTKSLQESVASNEVSGKIYGTIGPNPTGPEAPDVTIEVNGSYRLKVEAKKPTGVNPALGVMNVKKATIEIYYADTGSGNPTTGTPDGNQTQIGTGYEDTSSPYSVEIGVSAYGFRDYWARVKFTDGNSAESAWGLSAVFELNAENNTTDSGKASGVYIGLRVNTGNPFTQVTSYFANVVATGNTDSAKICELAFRVDEIGTFQADQDTPFSGATAPESTPISFGGYPGIFKPHLSWVHTWEITARIYNAFGWTNWSTPEALILAKQFDSTDDDVCNLAKFGAWTVDSPPPGGWTTSIPKPGGQQVRFSYSFLGPTGFPVANSSSVFQIGILGTKSATFPTETVLKSQGVGVSLVAKPGSLEATVSGFSATVNQYANKCLRLGSATAKNETDASLQVFVISSNTAGDPFTITLAGEARVMNLNSSTGAVTNWQIIEKPIWDLCDFWLPVPVDPEQLGAQPPSEASFESNVTGMKFMAYAHNAWGKGGKREADGTLTGSTTPGSAVYRIVGGIDTDDLKNDAVDYEKIQNSLIPKVNEVVFTAVSNNEISWTADTITYSGGGTDEIAAGSKSSMTLDTIYYFYYTPGSGSRTLYGTTSPSSAHFGTRVVAAMVYTDSDTDEMATIVPIGGPGLVIGAKVIIVQDIAAFNSTAVRFTAGHIRTAPSGSRLEMDSTDGFRNIDSSETTRVQIPADNSKIILTSGYNATTGLPEAGWIEFASAFHIIGGVGILPTTSGSGDFLIGSSGSLYTYRPFNEIQMVVDTAINLELRTDSALLAAVYLTTAGVALISGDSCDIAFLPGESGNVIIEGEGDNNISLDSSGNLTVAAKLGAPIVECDYLRPKTAAASGIINLYEDGTTVVTSRIYTDTANHDSGFSAGEDSTAHRGFIGASAQTSGTARAGIMFLHNENGDPFYFWVDHATPPSFRFSSSDPSSNDLGGTIIATLPA